MTDEANSILASTKKLLGLVAEYKVFDVDIMTHINTAFGTLSQLGVGPAQGFMITGDSETWDTFLEGDPRLGQVRSYVYLRVRLLFDPPSTAHQETAFGAQVKELEWRLNVQSEGAFG